MGRHSTLEVRSIHLGGLFHAEEEIQMTSTITNFVGQLQGFVFNGHRFERLTKQLKKIPSKNLINFYLFTDL